MRCFAGDKLSRTGESLTGDELAEDKIAGDKIDMNRAFKNLFTLSLGLLCVGSVCISAQAQGQAQANDRSSFITRTLNKYASLPSLPALPGETAGKDDNKDFLSLVFPVLRDDTASSPQLFINEATSTLYREIAKRLGVRYRFYGTDDRGYDCSGFVWRVFQSAGNDFERVAARSLWAQLPEATEEEKSQFGTLVFFNGLKHVGIVRDSKTFYHASRSQGVTLSTYDGYWGGRITGYRRAPAGRSK